MSEKWTNGPWQSQHDFSVDGICTIIGNIDGPDDGRYTYTVVCDVDEEPDAYLANARLIASAPDLYRLLSAAINYLAVYAATMQDGQAAELLTKCTAALAKARGEASPTQTGGR